MALPHTEYFRDYYKVHRMASEHLLQAVRDQDPALLNDSRMYAMRALAVADTDEKRCLAIGIGSTIEQMIVLLHAKRKVKEDGKRKS